MAPSQPQREQEPRIRERTERQGIPRHTTYDSRPQREQDWRTEAQRASCEIPRFPVQFNLPPPPGYDTRIQHQHGARGFETSRTPTHHDREYQRPYDVRPAGLDYSHYAGSQTDQGGLWNSSALKTFHAYATVDARRSYREDSSTFSGGQRHQPQYLASSGLSTANVPSSHQPQPTSYFTAYQPLRSVQSYARYPEYRVTKASHRISNGQRELAALNGLNQAGKAKVQYAQTQHTYPLRSKQPGTFASVHTKSYDQPIPSIEPTTGYVSQAQAGLEKFRRNQPRRSTPRRTPQRDVTPPLAPEASQLYLSQAKLPPVDRLAPQKLLVILDLNGTLIARPHLYEPKVFKIRPGVPKLLDYLFENHVVMIFTSMQRKNAATIVEQLFSEKQRKKMVALWTRDRLGLTAEQLHVKTQTYKNLSPIWLDVSIQAQCPAEDYRERHWDQTNTVLIDDSHPKALSHPHNLLLVPEFSKADAAKKSLPKAVKKHEEAILQSLILKLEELKNQADVSRLILQWQTGKAEVPKEPRTGVVVDEKMQSHEPVQLMTPESVTNDDEEDSQDDEVHKNIGEQMAKVREEEDRAKREVSEVPESVWADLLSGGDKGKV